MNTQFGTLVPDGKGGAKKINSLSVNLYEIESDDPIAFALGFHMGLAGQPMDKPPKRDKLAPEYVRGYRLGVEVKAGKAPMPEWARAAK